MSIEEEVIAENPDLSYTRVREICATMMFSQDRAQKRISHLSGGEKARVLLAKILAKSSNVLLLDEPTNHLDMESVSALMRGVCQYSGLVMMVTHDEWILSNYINKFIVFKENSLSIFEGSYSEFIENQGFENIQKENISKIGAKKGTHASYKNERRHLVLERSKLTTPLKKHVKRLEEQVLLSEEKVEELQQILSSIDVGKNFAKHSKELGGIESKLDILYQEYDRVNDDISKIEIRLDDALEKLDKHYRQR
ncbi:ATP-binding cassette domain-containing protein [Bacteriovoracaceae bacterium]|nr:ATP-binding cassette domain-containing protein [Bacteriovoracaceae bacterium]